MERRPVLLSAYTPSVLSTETLEEIFVQREPLAQRLLAGIRESATTATKQHNLLVGPRGIGKTHLVSLLYHRIQKDTALVERLRIGWLREEAWEVLSYHDLLVSILNALATEYRDTELARNIEGLIDLPLSAAQEKAEQLLLQFLGARTLLLIAENFDDILSQLEDDGQKRLRAFLQNHNNCVILATTPSLSDDLSAYSAPFYGFFNVHPLRDLTRAEARELLEKIASLSGDTDLSTYLKTDEADHRLKVVETLAGGHPRIWILFAGCMTKSLLNELVPLFFKMLDDLTPYYQERMRSLPSQQRRIVAYLCQYQGAAPVKEIAKNCRLTAQLASAQIHNLEEKGFVRKAKDPQVPTTGDRRIAFYELREPLMRLCLDVKDNRGEPLRLIVEFLRLWYNPEELKDRLNTLCSENQIERMYILAALQELKANKKTSAKTKIEKRYGSWVKKISQLIQEGLLEEALSSTEREIRLNPKNALFWFWKGEVLEKIGHREEAITAYQLAIDLYPDNTIDYIISNLSKALLLVSIGKIDEASTICDALNKNINLPKEFSVQLENLMRLIAKFKEIEGSIMKHSDPEHLAEIYSILLNQQMLCSTKSREELKTHAFLVAGLFRQWNALITLGASFLCIHELTTPALSDTTIEIWLSVWEEVGRGEKELEISLRILRAAVEYRKTKDQAVLLRLPAEERAVLEKLLSKNPDL